MCRNCALPEWGEPIKVPVGELPQFFAKQISWNFERLNYGGGAIMETVSGRPERPSVTGRLGCRLREGIQPPTRGKRTERYLLVSECLYCPGKRYGCTPRANCTGKRRNCYAMCKVTVYADVPDVAEVSFSGSHGSGNVTDPSLHRSPHDPKRRRLAEDDSIDQTQRWKESDRPTMVESLSSDGPNLNHPSTNMVTVDVGQNVILTGSNVDVVNPHNNSSSPEIVLWTSSAGEHPGSHQTSASWANSNGSSSSGQSTPSTPLNTPLSVPGLTLQSPTHTNARGAPPKAPGLNSQSIRVCPGPKGSIGQPLSPSWRTEAKFSASKMRVNQQHHDTNQEILTLKQHILILQQEHLSKISRIAELEAELQSIKENELSRLEVQLQRLEKENLKKDVRILQLEKQLQAAVFSRAKLPSNSVAVPVQHQSVSDGVPSRVHVGKSNDATTSHVVGGKDDDEVEGKKDQEEKEMDKEDDIGDDDAHSVEEV